MMGIVGRQYYTMERCADGSFSPAGSGSGSYGGSYEAARTDRRETNTWNPAGTDADSASVPDLARLRSRSRDAVRNQPLAGGAINTTVTNVVGSGLTLQSTIDAAYLGMNPDDADLWQNHTEREFGLWSESDNCSYNRSLNFKGLTELAFRSTLENGDVFANTPRQKLPDFPYDLRVQLIEADRVCNPNFGFDGPRMVSGIEKDTSGAPLAYNVLRQHPGNWLYVTGNSWTWDNLPAFNPVTGLRNVLHVYRTLRIDQSRGVPMLAPVIEPLKQLNRYQQHELMAAAVTSMFTVFVKTQGGQGLGNMPLPFQNPAVPAPIATTSDLSLGSGNVVDLNPGEEVEFADPKRPSAGFDPFFLAIVRQIGVALEIPFEILIKHYTASYSAARAAMLDAWKFFLSRRTWLAGSFCQPIYEIWLAEAVALGRVSAPGFFNDPMIRKAYCASQWNGPGRGMISEKDEAAGAEKRIALGMTTAGEETAAYNGSDWDAKQARRIKERRLRDEAGLPTPGVTAKEAINEEVTAPPAQDKPEAV